MSLEGPPGPSPESVQQETQSVKSSLIPYRPDQVPQRGDPDFDEPIDPQKENRNLLTPHRSFEVGKKGFSWRDELSENAQKLYRCLLFEKGDTEYLPNIAEIEGFDLGAALEELRKHSAIDESDPRIIKLPRRE